MTLNSYQRQRMRRDGSNTHIERMFRREKEIKQAVWEAKNDSHGRTGGGNSGHALVSDPTAAAAMHQVEEVREVTLADGYNVRWPERWLRVINATYDKYPASERAIRLRCSGYAYADACEELHIGKTTYYAMLNDADSFAFAAACQLQLVRAI